MRKQNLKVPRWITKTPTSVRDITVYELHKQGLKNIEIAQRLDLSPSMVFNLIKRWEWREINRNDYYIKVRAEWLEGENGDTKI